VRTDQVEALSVMLGTARIMSEEKFDKEAATELRLSNAVKDLPAIKQHLIDRGQHRLQDAAKIS
jgi:hypothetical protein